MNLVLYKTILFSFVVIKLKVLVDYDVIWDWTSLFSNWLIGTDRTRTNTRKVSFQTLYGGQFTLPTQLIMLNYLVILSHRCNTTIFFPSYPLYSVTCLLLCNERDSGPQRDKCSKSFQKAANLRLFPLVSTCIIMGQFKKPQTLEFQMEHQCLESNTSVQSQKLLPIFGH